MVRDLMPQLLAGSSRDAECLREQYARAQVSSVETTGGGFFVHFEVPSDAPVAAPESAHGGPGGGAELEGEGLGIGAGAILWLDRGRIDALELYAPTDDWPEDLPVRVVSVEPRLSDGRRED